MNSGTKNIAKRTTAISRIEKLTELYKRKRLTTESYIAEVNAELMNLNESRNYCEYLRNIGQL